MPVNARDKHVFRPPPFHEQTPQVDGFKDAFVPARGASRAYVHVKHTGVHKVAGLIYILATHAGQMRTKVEH